MPEVTIMPRGNARGAIVRAYVSGQGDVEDVTTETTGSYVYEQVGPLAVAMRPMDLTEDEARELRAHVEHPSALPTRQPRDLPAADPSILRRRRR